MSTPARTLVMRTARLELHRTSEHTDIDALLDVFNSNPDWIATTNDFAGQPIHDRSDVQMFVWQATMGEGSTCVEIRDPGRDELIGVLGWMAPHPRDRCPWIGCIVLRADRRCQGFGSEVLRALERFIAAEGWEQVRASPLVCQPWAQAFLESLGYTAVEERLDQDKRRCIRSIFANCRSASYTLCARQRKSSVSRVVGPFANRAAATVTFPDVTLNRCSDVAGVAFRFAIGPRSMARRVLRSAQLVVSRKRQSKCARNQNTC